MTGAPVVAGVFVDIRPVPSRNVVRVAVEFPIEQGDDVHAALGGYPKSGESRWVALALLDPNATAAPAPPVRQIIPPPHKPVHVKEPRRWREMSMSQQAGTLSNDPEFQAWCGAANTEAAAEFIRLRCGVGSRSELNINPVAAEQWQAISRAFFARFDAAQQEHRYQRG
jgi:hypothetical protein